MHEKAVKLLIKNHKGGIVGVPPPHINSERIKGYLGLFLMFQFSSHSSPNRFYKYLHSSYIEAKLQ